MRGIDKQEDTTIDQENFVKIQIKPTQLELHKILKLNGLFDSLSQIKSVRKVITKKTCLLKSAKKGLEGGLILVRGNLLVLHKNQQGNLKVVQYLRNNQAYINLSDSAAGLWIVALNQTVCYQLPKPQLIRLSKKSQALQARSQALQRCVSYSQSEPFLNVLASSVGLENSSIIINLVRNDRVESMKLYDIESIYKQHSRFNLKAMVQLYKKTKFINWEESQIILLILNSQNWLKHTSKVAEFKSRLNF